MADQSRREALALGLAAATASTLPSGAMAAAPLPRKAWPTGIEQQRKGDLGNETYLNPVLAGDQPDPSVLKDGDVYYKVSSSFHYYPGLIVWTSTDLVNWSPIGPALRQPLGSVFAPDLIKHEGRYYIYFPAANF